MSIEQKLKWLEEHGMKRLPDNNSEYRYYVCYENAVRFYAIKEIEELPLDKIIADHVKYLKYYGNVEETLSVDPIRTPKFD